MNAVLSNHVHRSKAQGTPGLSIQILGAKTMI